MPSIEPCSQPDCPLREKNVDSRFLANLVVQVLAGENGSYPAAERSPIHPYERCVECVLQIQRGGRPPPSLQEIEDLLEAGRWSHRRFRRGARRDQRDLRESEF